MVQKRNLGNLLFYVFWTLIIAGKAWGLTSLNKIYIYITYVAVIFAILKLCFTKWTKKELLIVILLNSLGILIYISTKDAAALLLTISISSLKCIDIEKLIGYSLFVKATLFFTKISLALAGIIDKQAVIRYDFGDNHVVRYSLGYGQPNAAHNMLFIIYTLIVLKYKNKLKSYHFIIMAGINYWLYTYTNSRTGLFVSFLLIFITWMLSQRWNNNINKILLWISTKCYYIGAAISIFTCFLFSKFSFLSSFGTLTSRIITSIKVIKTKPLTLFGCSNIITDLGYINMLYEKGIIFFVIFLVALSYLLKYLKKKNDIYGIAVFVSISIYMFSEAYFESIVVNTALIYLGYILFSHNQNKINDCKIVNEN